MAHPATLLAALAALAIPGALSRVGAPSGPPDVGCSAAIDYAETLLAGRERERYVFQEEVARDQPLGRGVYYRLAPRFEETSPPPASLVERLAGQGKAAAVARCPALRRMLTARGIAIGRAAADAAIRNAHDGRFAATIVGLSLPAVSDDGKSALLTIDTYSGYLGGGGLMNYLEIQPDGKWKLVSSAGMWIS